ncbi:MAG TPA: glycosyltransferase, partial [Ignavibacteria bacterium]|nr:glycosyltransferase [Ignavibacteria bacterium]
MEKVKPKYKVCIVTAILPPSYGGAEVAAFKYAVRLHSDPDSEVIVIGWDRAGAYEKNTKKFDFVHSVRISEKPSDSKGIFIYTQQLTHMWNCFKVLIIPMWKLRKKYDYVHNFNSGFAFNRVSIFIAKLIGKKVVTETSLVGDDDPLSLGRILSWKDYLKPKYLRYLFYKMADRYVSKSEVITDIFRKSEIPMSKVAQIPYSVDVNEFSPLDIVSKKSLRNKLNIWDEGKIILFVGGINVRKGVHILVEAFISIEKKYPDLKLLIVGPTYKYDQKYIANIQDRIRSLNLQDKIVLTEKNVSNVEEYMQCSDIFVLPSRQEGFPISIIEAMSCGLAVVGSDIPEIAKTQISDGIDGYVFTRGSVEKLVLVLKKILDEKEITEKLSHNARMKAVNNWSVEIVDKSYRDLYTSIKNNTRYKEKIKILYTVSGAISAEKRDSLLRLIAGMDKEVFETSVCYLNNNKEQDFSVSESNAVVPRNNNIPKESFEDSNSLLKFYKLFKKEDPDIIHSMSETEDYAEALAAKITGIKWVFTDDSFNNNIKISQKSKRYKLSNGVLTEFKEKLTVTPGKANKYFSIPSGVNIKEYSPNGRDKNIILKYNTKGSSPVILSITKNIKYKGLETLIKSFSLVCEDYDNAKLIIAGNFRSELSDKINQLISKKGITDKIIFTDSDEKIKDLSGIADIFVLSCEKVCNKFSGILTE